jgi:hypothetical protein
MAQVLQYLPTKPEDLSSITSIAKEKEKEKKNPEW